jgi:peptidoglycan/LPS O-acetylase OafA/YrhL
VSAQSVERPVGVATTTGYLPELEALRGWAILLVMAFHVDGFMLGLGRQAAMLSTTSPLLAYVRAGNTGVNLFFALSGFLLSLPFFGAARSGRPFVLRRYAARRALRILPLYYAAVIATGTRFVLAGASPLAILPYFLFLNALPHAAMPMMPYSLTWWSLATEAQFYLLLPLLGPGLRRRWVGVLLLGAFAAAYGAFLAGWLPRGGWLSPGGAGRVQAVGVSVLGRGPLFLAGMAAAWVFARHGERLRAHLERAAWARYGGADLALGAVLLALGMLLSWGLTTGPLRIQQPPLHAWHVLEGLLWATVVLLFVVAPLRVKPLFANRVLERLGVLSYSLYLLHVPIMIVSLGYLRRAGMIGAGWSFRAAAAVVVLGLASVAASSLTYRYIERPFLVRKERFGERSVAAAAAARVAAKNA